MNISIGHLLLVNAGIIMLVGFYGIISRKNLVKILLSLNILQVGVNLLLVALGWVENGVAPILKEGHTLEALQSAVGIHFVDPLPQALVLTAIVIGFGTTAVALTIIINYHKTHKSLKVHNFANEMAKPDEEEVVE